jgi:hypothetical protein
VETRKQENRALTAAVVSLTTEGKALRAYQTTTDTKILELNMQLEDYMTVGTDLQHQIIDANQCSGETIHSLQQDNLTYRASINKFQTTNNRLLAGLTYTFEKTVIQQFKFPIEFKESEIPTTFSALEKLLKEDWRPWTENAESTWQLLGKRPSSKCISTIQIKQVAPWTLCSTQALERCVQPTSTPWYQYHNPRGV